MAKKHVHKYHRVMVNGVKVFACGEPDCNHHMPKHYEDMLKGKNTYCWKCGEVFKLDSISMGFDFPWCIDCRIGLVSGGNDDSLANPSNAVLERHDSAVIADTPHEPAKSTVKVLNPKDLDAMFRK